VESQTLRKLAIVAGAVIIVIGLIIYFLNSFQGGVVSADFTASRQKAASISQGIVNLTGETSRKISEANIVQGGNNVNQLLDLINEAKKTNAAAYQKAFDLSSALREMAGSLNGVGQTRQQLGYEAVALELSLVSEFISYTGTLNDFLNNLSKAVLDQNSASRKAAEDALKIVNEKTILINGLNGSFLEKMSAFDR
jgi:hypothetical protein